MKKTKKSIRIINKTEFVVCNVCGEKIAHADYIDNYISVEKNWGYGSPHDGETHSFELCGKCYDELISKFKIKL